ncbi:MAG: SH3 domain-containing protein [Pseudomonadota bacterium]
MITLLACLGLASVLASDVDSALAEARDAVQRGDFAAAEGAYQRAIAVGGASADLLYNQGTAALKAGHIGEASLALERGQRLAPADEDIAFNLARVHERIGGPLASAAVLPRPGASVLQETTSTWQRRAIVALGVMLLLLAGRAASVTRWVLARRLLLATALACGAAGMGLGVVALQRAELDARGDAVLVAPASQAAREAPASDAPAVFTIEPGMPLQIVDRYQGFARIRLLNGLEGWVVASTTVQLAEQDR